MIKNKLQKIFIMLLTSLVVWPLMSAATGDVVVSAQQKTSAHLLVLSASCAACHGSNGNAVTGSNENRNAILAGRDVIDFTTKILGFKDGSRSATVMHHHAKGLTDDEIRQLAAYFSQQKRVATTPVKSQILKVDHE
jgi:cytochrome c553